MEGIAGMIRDIDESRFSKDYALLLYEMKKRSLVCVVDCSNCRDVAQTLYDDAPTLSGDGVYVVSVRGMSYIWAHSSDDFVKQCKSFNLAFLP